MKKLFRIVLLFMLSNVSLSAQYSYSQDYNKEFKSNLRLSDSLMKIDPKLSFKYAMKAIEIAENFKDSSAYYEALLMKSISLNYLSKSEEAISTQLKVINFFKEKNDTEKLAFAYSCIGSSYLKTQDFIKGISFLTTSNELFESIGQLDKVGRNYGNIGVVYYYQKQYNKAIYNYRKALNAHEKLNNKSGIASMYNNIGVSYDLMGKQDSALIFYQKSFSIRKELNEKQGMAELLSNIGVIHKNKGNYLEALVFYKQSKKLKEELNDIYGLGISHENIGSLYIKLKKYDKSLQEYTKAEEYYKMNNSLVDLTAIYKNIAECYAYIGNYKKAYEYFHIHKDYSDSLNMVEISDKINEIESKYESEKKDRKIENLNKDKLLKETQLIAKQRESEKNKVEAEKLIIQKYYLFGGLFLALIFGGIIFNRFRTTRKQKSIIEEQKETVDKAFEELEEKNTEIMDSINYAKRIQSAILPPNKLVKEYIPNSFIHYKPKDIVAGDFYWMEPTNDGVLYAAADCTGHGVPGAMVSVVCNNGLNRSVREYGLNVPGEILNKTREIVIQEFEKSEDEVKDGMDIALCKLTGNRLEYAGAHNPLWIIRKGATEIEEIKANKQPIGKFLEPKPYTTHKVELNSGDSIYIFSDGFPDQFGGEKGKKFKSGNFKKLLLSIQHETMEAQEKILDQAFEDWRGELEQIDDVCIIGVRI